MNKMSPRLRRILKEQQKRQIAKANTFNTPGFTAQNNFINDQSPLKAAQTTRRAGKSYAAGLMLFQKATQIPNCSVLYITKTRDSAKRIMFNPVLGEINRQMNLNAKANRSELSYTLPNGSIIYCLGIDNSPEEADKLLGQKYPLVVIDESAFIRRDLENIVYEHLKPAVADYNGQIVLISTTSDMLNCFFYKVTEEDYPGWTVHKWTAYDNPFMKKAWDKEIKELKKTNPRIVDTPRFKRHYLNQWCISEDATVYRIQENNIIPDIPEDDTITDFLLGLDLGWNDATAFSITGYSKKSGKLYVLETFKQSQMTLTQVAQKIKRYQHKYPISTIIVDGASKQAIEEMRARYDINFKIADKINKREFIEVMNDELLLGNISLLSANTQALQDEYSNLIWDEKAKTNDKWVELAACDNHLADATLYAWRYSYTYLKDLPAEPYVAPTSEEAVDKHWEEEERKLAHRQSDDYDYLTEGMEDEDMY